MPPTFTEINYDLRLLADLHIGSGVGLPGMIDEYIVRDHEDFAYAPFSEIKGIVRDSCVQLMKHLECYETEDVCKGHHALIASARQGTSPKAFCGLSAEKLCVLCYLFGSPITPARWWFSPARYAPGYREAVNKFAEALADSKTRKRSLAKRDSASSAHASLEPLTKRAAEDHLFNLEVMRLPDAADEASPTEASWKGQLVFQPPMKTEKAGVRRDDEMLCWLLAALLFTKRIGGRRRRGWGSCRFELSGSNKVALEQLLADWLDNDCKLVEAGSDDARLP